ncbi:MAG: hypothetical protein C5B50_06295 [Verrucomicrobia bacterium]|nr:MAG: hypothetical protein C5B50_06295 [Verrucomicrobiota bacterium]
MRELSGPDSILWREKKLKELTEKFRDRKMRARKFHGKKIKKPFSCCGIFMPSLHFIFLKNPFIEACPCRDDSVPSEEA